MQAAGPCSPQGTTSCIALHPTSTTTPFGVGAPIHRAPRGTGPAAWTPLRKLSRTTKPTFGSGHTLGTSYSNSFSEAPSTLRLSNPTGPATPNHTTNHNSNQVGWTTRRASINTTFGDNQEQAASQAASHPPWHAPEYLGNCAQPHWTTRHQDKQCSTGMRPLHEPRHPARKDLKSPNRLLV